MIVDLFSKRARLNRGELPEVYVYDELPNQLRVQIVYLFDKTFDKVCPSFSDNREDLYDVLVKFLREERGVFHLINKSLGDRYFDVDGNYEREVTNYFLLEGSTAHALDVVELFFRISFDILEKNYSNVSWQDNFQKIIEHLNTRFKENGIGYCFVRNSLSLIRIDSEIIHETIVKPALKLLHSRDYKNAEDEYLSAHLHYRNGRYTECLNDCLKCIESTIKIIAHKREWLIQENDTAKKLIEHVMTNKLIPNYLQSHFSALRCCLESDAPTVRNKNSGHGKGIKEETVPAYLAEYLLGETATTIRLFVEAEKEMPDCCDG